MTEDDIFFVRCLERMLERMAEATRKIAKTAALSN